MPERTQFESVLDRTKDDPKFRTFADARRKLYAPPPFQIVVELGSIVWPKIAQTSRHRLQRSCKLAVVRKCTPKLRYVIFDVRWLRGKR